MKILLKILLTMLLVLVSSCKDTGLEENVMITYPDDTYIVPLGIGFSWTYKVTVYNMQEEVDSSYIIVMEADTTITDGDNNIWYRLRISSGEHESEEVYARNDTSGLLLKPGNMTQKAADEFRYPAKIGLSYRCDTIADSPEEGCFNIRHLTGTDEEIKISSGIFRCYKYWDEIYTSDKKVLYNPWKIYYLSPNIGLILHINYQISGLGKVYIHEKYELIEYKIDLSESK